MRITDEYHGARAGMGDPRSEDRGSDREKPRGLRFGDVEPCRWSPQGLILANCAGADLQHLRFGLAAHHRAKALALLGGEDRVDALEPVDDRLARAAEGLALLRRLGFDARAVER